MNPDYWSSFAGVTFDFISVDCEQIAQNDQKQNVCFLISIFSPPVLCECWS